MSQDDEVKQLYRAIKNLELRVEKLVTKVEKQQSDINTLANYIRSADPLIKLVSSIMDIFI
ncbi:hypothetical protein NIES4074_23960 [Cylindrospermum sp. NIES-4074]|nr:hypothetical protein NIES4074_23960 [Cylindrospermum sp. NIES-4074]